MQVVDFNSVPSHQADMHERLINWARWCKPSASAGVHPMFRGFKPYLYPEREAGIPIDSRDATEIQKVMRHLPEKHRHALGWCYVIRSNPAVAARILGVSKEGLLALIVDARTMVANRLRAKECATA